MSSSSIDDIAKDGETSIGDDGSSQHATTEVSHTVTPSLRSMGKQTDSADPSVQTGSCNAGSDGAEDNFFGLLTEEGIRLPSIGLQRTGATYEWQDLVQCAHARYRCFLASEGYRARQLTFDSFTVGGHTTTMSFNFTGVNKRFISVFFLINVAEVPGLNIHDPVSVCKQWGSHLALDKDFTCHNKDQPEESLTSILIALCTKAGGTVHVCGTTDGTTAWYRRDHELVDNASVTIGWSYVFYGVIDPSASEEPEDGYFTASEDFPSSDDEI
jgi:hypothetical protein